MTLLQQAYSLMQEQPEKNIRLIIALLETMTPKEDTATETPTKAFKRTGLAKDLINLPDDFDETFDALDKDIAELFYGDSLSDIY